MSKSLLSIARPPDGKPASDMQSKAPAQQVVAEKSLRTPNVSVRLANVPSAIQPAPYKNVQVQITPALKTAAKAADIGLSDSRRSKAIKHEENVATKSVVQNDQVANSHAPHGETVEKPHGSHGRPYNHVYPCTSSDGREEKNAAISADIRNYTEPGEDLDWTKVSDPTERKRLQGVIGGHKYRERQLAIQGKGGSGGNYPGAAGEGSYLSKGYGPQRPYGYSKSKSLRPLQTTATHTKSNDLPISAPGSTILYKALIMKPGSSAPRMADSNVPRHNLSKTDHGRKPVIYHGLDEQRGDHWNHDRLTSSIEHVGSIAAQESSQSVLMISDTGQEAQGNSGDQGSYKDFFQSLVGSVTPQGSRQGTNSASFTDDGRQQSMTSHSSTSMLMYDLDDGYQGPENEQPTWEPNAGDVACFQLDKPMKTAFNMFARSAHDAHRFPAKTRKNVVETYHLFIRQV